jgi:hypothetical protein
MPRRHVALLLAAAVAVAATVPAFGNGDSLASRALALASSAKKDARAANSRSKRALRLARKKASRGPRGRTGATGPQGPQGPTGPQGPQGVGYAATGFAEAAGAVGTTSATYVALAGGPSVTVTVPASGVIDVAAQATLLDASDADGAVALYEDGAPMPGQADCTGVDPGLFVIPSGAGDFEGGTPAGLGLACVTLGAGGDVLFHTTPGQHTYELRYAACGCNPGTAEFANRRLYVTPRP